MEKNKTPLAAYENIRYAIYFCPMDNALESYRASKGFFYSVTHRLICRRTPRLNYSSRYNMNCSVNVCCLMSLSSFVINDELKFCKLI